MNEVQEKKEKIISFINNLPEDKLIVIEDFIRKISDGDNLTIEHIYKEAVEKYHETLQKLAQ